MTAPSASAVSFGDVAQFYSRLADTLEFFCRLGHTGPRLPLPIDYRENLVGLIEAFRRFADRLQPYFHERIPWTDPGNNETMASGLRLTLAFAPSITDPQKWFSLAVPLSFLGAMTADAAELGRVDSFDEVLDMLSSFMQ